MLGESAQPELLLFTLNTFSSILKTFDTTLLYTGRTDPKAEVIMLLNVALSCQK